MDVLFTGNLGIITKNFYNEIWDDYKCILYGDEKKGVYKNKNVISYDYGEEDQIEKIFTTFNFEMVVYFSYSVDGRKKIFDELEKIESVLYQCRKCGVKRFLYVVTNDLEEKDEKIVQERSRYIIINACKDLCRAFAEENWINAVIVNVPYVYDTELGKSHLSEWILEGIKNQKVILPGSEDIVTDFLNESDLGNLIARIIDEAEDDKIIEMYISGGNVYKMEEVSRLLSNNLEGIATEYVNKWSCIPKYIKNDIARSEYGWYPQHDFLEDTNSLINNIKRIKKLKQNKKNVKEKYDKYRKMIRIVFELIITFALAQFLNYWTKDNVFVNFIDFRIIYIVMMGMMNGMMAGVSAAILSCAGYVFHNASTMEWQVVFYNVQNWLPFASYFLLGAITGYARDKHDDEIVYEREEREILEQKYTFLNEIYNEVLENKEQFNNQIISYKNSYGKLYSVVKKLDSILPDEIFYEAVSVLEEMLENNTVAIYSFNQKYDFARLNVCSKRMNMELNKSLKMSFYPEITNCFKKKSIFVNTQSIMNYPSYAAPIYRNNELLGMIIIMYAAPSQMNMEFSNKFTIVTNLIRDSLIRAVEFGDKTNNYIDGTQILKAGSFRQILSVKSHMQEKQYMEYSLLKISNTAGRKLTELSTIICSLVRNNDVLGMGDDGEIYLLLNQTREEDMSVITERMNKNNISFEVVRDV